MAPWASIAFALDWQKPPRQMNSPSFHYVNSDQWRYERTYTEPQPVSRPDSESHRDMTQEHTLDANIRAVRMGWLPSYPQFNISSLEIVRKAEQAGAKSDAEIKQWVVNQLEVRRIEVCSSGSRCSRKLASPVVHLARQCVERQREGTGIFLQALSGYAQSDHFR
jgi:nitrate reductase alpha subunit